MTSSPSVGEMVPPFYALNERANEVVREQRFVGQNKVSYHHVIAGRRPASDVRSHNPAKGRLGRLDDRCLGLAYEGFAVFRHLMSTIGPADLEFFLSLRSVLDTTRPPGA